MEVKTIIIRLILGLVLSGIIGFEREKNNSAAGLKTHTLVGLSATIIAIMQSIMYMEAEQMALANPEMMEFYRQEPGRIIAQVISGVGFLGAGTILVTKRHISGLTTAASIWSVSSLGLAIGMGYYTLSLLSFLAVEIVLVIVKKYMHINNNTDILIKILDLNYVDDIKKKIINENFDVNIKNFRTDVYSNRKIYSVVFSIKNITEDNFEIIMDILIKDKNVLSCEKTTLEY